MFNTFFTKIVPFIRLREKSTTRQAARDSVMLHRKDVLLHAG
jgi:hypothetical protein